MVIKLDKNMIDSKELSSLLSQCIGTERYYCMPVPRLLYTDGVKLFVDKAGAYWLLVDIGLFLHDRPNLRSQYFLDIQLKVTEDNKGKLVFDDGNGNVLFERSYKYIVPVGEWHFFYTSDVLMLPSEY